MAINQHLGALAYVLGDVDHQLGLTATGRSTDKPFNGFTASVCAGAADATKAN